MSVDSIVETPETFGAPAKKKKCLRGLRQDGKCKRKPGPKKYSKKRPASKSKSKKRTASKSKKRPASKSKSKKRPASKKSKSKSKSKSKPKSKSKSKPQKVRRRYHTKTIDGKRVVMQSELVGTGIKGSPMPYAKKASPKKASPKKATPKSKSPKQVRKHYKFDSEGNKRLVSSVEV